MKGTLIDAAYEHKREPLISKTAYRRRVMNNTVLGSIILAIAWLIGIVGYRCFEGLGWIDSMLNAAMILGGMGPVDILHSDAAKVFASLYAIFSGVLFLAVIGLVAAPVFHRFLHRFHLEDQKTR